MHGALNADGFKRNKPLAKKSFEIKFQVGTYWLHENIDLLEFCVTFLHTCNEMFYAYALMLRLLLCALY